MSTTVLTLTKQHRTVFAYRLDWIQFDSMQGSYIVLTNAFDFGSMVVAKLL